MLVVIEGIDGSGKNTQTGLLLDALRGRGLTAGTFSFPRYGSGPFAQAIGDYLNGKYGSLSSVPPQLAALLYAGDRFAAKPELEALLGTCDVVVCDRYVASNLAHQGSKLPAEQRPEFVRWLSEIEYEAYGLPVADLTILLDVPVDVAAELVLKKNARSYTTAAADLHERDLAYLEGCHSVYHQLAEAGVGGHWHYVPCTTPDRQMRAVEAISNDVTHAVLGCLQKVVVPTAS